MDRNVNQPAWRARMPLNLSNVLHVFPKHPERTLPKFDSGKGISIEYHLKRFFLSQELLNINHEDVVCRRFPHTFEPKMASWFFSL